MGQITALILLISAMCFLPSCVSQHRHIFIKTPKTWFEAQRYCRENYMDLATIDDMREMEALLESVEGNYDDAVWIGLSKGTTKKWHWSLADRDFYKEGERNYFNWNQIATHNCANYQNRKLNQVSCDTLLVSLCFDGKKHERERYVLIKDKKKWMKARDYCREHHTDLASVRNEVESEIIQEVTAGLTVWVGLFRDPWQWSDQTDSSLRYWKADHGVFTDDQKSCVTLLKSQSGRWGERPCGEKLPFLCNIGTFVNIIKLRFNSWDSVLDQNDPAVQDGILKQLEQELKKKGVTNVILRWTKQPDGSVFFKEPRQGG